MDSSVHVANLVNTRDISWYTQSKSPITLKGRSASSDIEFSIPDKAAVASVSMHLIGMNSASLIKSASQLLLSLNGQPVKQTPLDGASTKIDTMVDLPIGDLRNGLNRLTFSVTQRASQQCEAPNDPQLWTRISAGSRLAIAYKDSTHTPTLADLRQIFAEARPNESNVLVLYDPALAHTPEPIMAAARSVAKLEGRQTVQILARPLNTLGKAVAQTFPGTVVILEQVAGGSSSEAADPATLSIARNPVGGAMLTLSGQTPNALVGAARLIGRDGVVWPDAAHAQITVPAAHKIDVQDGAHKDVSSEKATSTTFRAVGFPPQTVSGHKTAFPPVTFWNPNWDSHAILYLHLAYSAGGGPGSMIQAIVDGKMVNTIPLTNADGGSYPDYKLLIPQNALNVGRNTLILKPVFNTQHTATNACLPNDFDNSLGVTVFSDSHLSIFGGSPVAKDDLTAIRSGVYHIRTIAIAAATPAAISAAATLGAKLAQVVPHNPLQLVWEPHAKSSIGTLVLGAESTLPAALLAQSGIARTHTMTAVTEPADQTPSVPGLESFGAVRSWLGHTLGYSAEGASSRDPLARGRELGASVTGFSNTAIMAIADATGATAAPSSVAPSIVLTAQNDSELEHAVNSLVMPNVWRQLAGQAVVIASDSATLQVMPALNVPVSSSARLGFLSTQHPVATVLAILGILIVLILMVRAFVALRRRRLHPSVKGVDER